MPNHHEIPHSSHQPLLSKDHGYFHSMQIMQEPAIVFAFCQDEAQLQELLKDLPFNLDQYLDLELKSADEISENEYQVKWENKPDKKISGSLTFLFKKVPRSRGTLLTVEAQFDKFSFNDQDPSTLINIFLKRMKALIETGEIPTTKGQPSGREELKTLH